jgi:hypothetical protein
MLKYMLYVEYIFVAWLVGDQFLEFLFSITISSYKLCLLKDSKVVLRNDVSTLRYKYSLFAVLPAILDK